MTDADIEGAFTACNSGVLNAAEYVRRDMPLLMLLLMLLHL